jgi:hypothetical protein
VCSELSGKWGTGWPAELRSSTVDCHCCHMDPGPCSSDDGRGQSMRRGFVSACCHSPSVLDFRTKMPAHTDGWGLVPMYERTERHSSVRKETRLVSNSYRKQCIEPFIRLSKSWKHEIRQVSHGFTGLCERRRFVCANAGVALAILGLSVVHATCETVAPPRDPCTLTLSLSTDVPVAATGQRCHFPWWLLPRARVPLLTSGVRSGEAVFFFPDNIGFALLCSSFI